MIGKFYNPTDNSWCINIHTRKDALIVQGVDKFYSPDKKEIGAKFIICKEPYLLTFTCFDRVLERTFINVKSTKTGRKYRVLFSEQNII